MRKSTGGPQQALQQSHRLKLVRTNPFAYLCCRGDEHQRHCQVHSTEEKQERTLPESRTLQSSLHHQTRWRSHMRPAVQQAQVPCQLRFRGDIAFPYKPKWLRAFQDEGGTLYLRVRLKPMVAMIGGINNISTPSTHRTILAIPIMK